MTLRCSLSPPRHPLSEEVWVVDSMAKLPFVAMLHTSDRRGRVTTTHQEPAKMI